MTTLDHGELMTPAELRSSLAYLLRDAASGLLLDPGLNKKAAAQAEALRQLLVGYEELVEATSSSNTGFEFRDLPLPEKAAYDQAKHVVRTLDKIYVEPTRPQIANHS